MPITKFRRFLKPYKNFYFINKRRVLKKRILLIDTPAFNQKTYCQGEGIVEIGQKCSFGYKLGGFYKGGCIELQARYKNAKIKIGDKVSTNNNIFLCAANYIIIGSNTLIGQNVIIMDHEAHGIDPGKRNQVGEIGCVEIGQNVWIGNNVSILKNSKVGDNSIVATGAVVSGEFPENVIIGGVPAKIIKNI